MIQVDARVNIFGDIKDMSHSVIAGFMKDTGYAYGGSYPNGEEGDEQVIGQVASVLTKAGILDPLPINPCRDSQERARRILRDWKTLSRSGPAQVWVIDSDPQSFLTGMRSANKTGDLPKDILESMTVVRLGSLEFYDGRDPIGIRVVHLPHSPYHFPTHPMNY